MHKYLCENLFQCMEIKLLQMFINSFQFFYGIIFVKKLIILQSANP